MFFPPTHVLFSHFCMQDLSPSVLPPHVCLGYTAEGSKCKSSCTIFLRWALISADDVSKEVKGTTKRPQQLLAPIHCLQIYVHPPTPRLSLSFLPHFQHYQYRSAVHLEPLFNNWLLWLIQAVMVRLADREGGRVWFKTVWKIYVISHE